jgi:hypothetical protein
MRNTILKSGALVIAILGFGAGSARANESLIKVPFPFVVGRQTLPAGEYLIERLDTDPSVMLIKARSTHDKSAAIVLGEQATGEDPAGNKPAMTFTHSEGQYRLSAIWESRSIGEDVFTN